MLFHLYGNINNCINRLIGDVTQLCHTRSQLWEHRRTKTPTGGSPKSTSRVPGRPVPVRIWYQCSRLLPSQIPGSAQQSRGNVRIFACRTSSSLNTLDPVVWYHRPWLPCAPRCLVVVQNNTSELATICPEIHETIYLDTEYRTQLELKRQRLY